MAFKTTANTILNATETEVFYCEASGVNTANGVACAVLVLAALLPLVTF